MKVASPASAISLLAIDAYQRHLSPRKGYRCAYSVVHGGTGCSGFAKHAIHSDGLVRAIPRIMQRFEDCRDAARMLRTDIDCGCAGDALPSSCDLPGMPDDAPGSSRCAAGCIDIPFCNWGSSDRKRRLDEQPEEDMQA